MRLIHTTQTQDRQIDNASQAFDNLFSIMEDLDNEITEWRVAALLLDCISPDELQDAINQLKKQQDQD
jgi:S-methylmethionine-dependent homocysteine/selenocysteine methylase